MSKVINSVNEIPTLDFGSGTSNAAIDIVIYSVDSLESIVGGAADCLDCDAYCSQCESHCGSYCGGGNAGYFNRMNYLINVMRRLYR